MKTLSTALVIILIALTGFLGYRYGSPKAGQVVVSQLWLDSLKRLADAPPDTIIVTDTIYPEPVIITIIKDVPTPIPFGDANLFIDTLKNKQLMVVVTDTVRDNRIIFRRFDYELYVPLRIETVTTINKIIPMPYPVTKNIYFNWYAGGSFGTDGWRVRGGKHFGRWMVGAYAGKGVSPSVGFEGTINF